MLHTVGDLHSAIMSDPTLSYSQKLDLIARLEPFTGDDPGTLLANVMYKLTGAGLGYLISKYLNMGPVGKAVMPALGFGLGTMIYNKMHQPKRTQAQIMFPGLY